MAADLVLTATLIHILRRKRTGFRRYAVRHFQDILAVFAVKLASRISTDSIIDVLVMYAVNTGAHI